MTSARRPGAARIEAAPIVVVIGTFDTKAAELGALSDEIERLGGIAIMLDTSARTAQRPSDAVIGTRRFIDQATVAAAAGSSIAAISELPRGEAVSALRSGVSRLLSAMVREGEIDGAVCMGGPERTSPALPCSTCLRLPQTHRLAAGLGKQDLRPLRRNQRHRRSALGRRHHRHQLGDQRDLPKRRRLHRRCRGRRRARRADR